VGLSARVHPARHTPREARGWYLGQRHVEGVIGSVRQFKRHVMTTCGIAGPGWLVLLVGGIGFTFYAAYATSGQ
jgi:hypothetical protein